MKRLLDWLDHRTGCRRLAREALYENVPGGARWRYVWGSTLTFGLAVQFITGIFLWMAYSPGSNTAWASVFYIQNEMAGGWLLRGIHHYTAHAMTILLVLHLMQVVIDGAYKAPREVNFWFGLILLLLVLGLSLTGYLLPWDQKGYWATKVATNLTALAPVVGPTMQQLIVGGPEYGHHTLTRFFALHAGVLPAMVIALVVAHIYLFRRHGLKAREPKRKPDAPFWPDQVLRDAVACLAVLAAVLFFVLRHRLLGSGGPLGAELGAPADPSEPYSAARPDWYFLSLFQFLKYFSGGSEVWGAIVLPGLVLVIVALMPVLGRWKLGHRFNVGFLFALVFGSALLTYLAIAEDRSNEHYRASVEVAQRDADRVRVLALGPGGIPPEGATALLHNDPFTQGPRLFSRNCAGCHRFEGTDALGAVPTEPQSAADLKGFASREWLAGLLDPEQVASTNYFGGTKFHQGRMVRFVKRDVARFTPEEKETLAAAIAAISAEAALPAQREIDARDAVLIDQGRAALQNDLRCTECHQFQRPDNTADAPGLTGYGSRQWLIDFISNPAHPRFYGDANDRMPAYGEDGILSPRQIELIVDWLRGDWYEPAAVAPR